MKLRKDTFLYLMIFGSLLLVIIPTITYIQYKGTFTLGDSFWIIGSVTGLLAFIVFFWEYVLSIKSIVAYFTHDVIAVINLHRWIGINALLLFLLHPLTLFFDDLINRHELLIKIIPVNNYDFKVIIGEVAFVLLLVIWISSYLARKHFSFRIWKLIHYLTYLVLPLTYLHADDIGTFLKSPFIKLYILGIMFLFVCIVFWRFLEFAGIRGKKYLIHSISMANTDVIQLELDPLDSLIVPGSGQFVDLRLHRLGESHPFSVFYYNPQNRHIFLAIKQAGRFTKNLMRLKPGRTVFLEGPYGIFTREIYYPAAKNIVLIAGGIGITPFIRFIEYLKGNYASYKQVFLFYANKTVADISLKKYLMSLDIPNLRVIFVVSREAVDPPFESGRVDVSMLRKYLGQDVKRYHYFMCGPQPLMDSVSADLKRNGVDDENIYKEEFGW